MSESLEVVSLCQCLHCDGIFKHPHPGPGGLQYSALHYAANKSLIWDDENERWVCPDCDTDDWQAYIEWEDKPQRDFIKLDAAHINWRLLDEERTYMLQIDADGAFPEVWRLINDVQTAAIDSGAKKEGEVHFD